MSINYQDTFPPDRIAAIRTAFEKTFGDTVVTDARLLTGGLSTAPVYRVTAGNHSYVMKLVPPHAYSSNDPFEKIASASAAGIAPPLQYKSQEAGIIISSFVENKPIRGIYSGTALAAKLGEAVKKVHAVPCSVPGDNLETVMDQLLAGFSRSGILRGPVPDECLAGYEKVKQVYPWQDTDRVFSHNDLNPTNILCDGAAVWIIDWDTAYTNDRYVDLACVANYFIYTPEQEAVLLQTYFGEVDEYKVARFYVMRQISRMIYSLMMLQLAAQAKPADHAHEQQMEGLGLQDVGPLIGSGKLSLATYDGQFMYGKALMNEAVAQMRSARFESALQLLGRHA